MQYVSCETNCTTITIDKWGNTYSLFTDRVMRTPQRVRMVERVNVGQRPAFTQIIEGTHCGERTLLVPWGACPHIFKRKRGGSSSS